ncbi:MAG: hypothetical protein J7K73_01395, partial [Nanoarchaeota archaeon]|nr:hypothetical protein [Nanoarchaeota archaeon]
VIPIVAYDDGTAGIPFVYKNLEGIQLIRGMELIYDPKEPYHFFMQTLPSYTLRDSEYFELINTEIKDNFCIMFATLSEQALLRVNAKGKLRGKYPNAVLTKNEKGEIDGYILKIEETFYKDTSQLHKEIYDDIDGLAWLCLEMDFIIKNMKITKNEGMKLSEASNPLMYG